MAARLESDVLLAACLDLAGSVGRHSDLVSKGELSGDNGTASVPKKEILVGAKTWHRGRTGEPISDVGCVSSREMK